MNKEIIIWVVSAAMAAICFVLIFENNNLKQHLANQPVAKLQDDKGNIFACLDLRVSELSPQPMEGAPSGSPGYYSLEGAGENMSIIGTMSAVSFDGRREYLTFPHVEVEAIAGGE